MPPLEFLCLLVGLTLAAGAAQWLADRRRTRIMGDLARQWRMQYIARDRFHLARRLAGCLPLPGAADLRVLDLMYQTDAGKRRYLFTCEFGRGVALSQRRRRRVATFEESVAAPPDAPCPPLDLADQSLPLLKQYESLRAPVSDLPS